MHYVILNDLLKYVYDVKNFFLCCAPFEKNPINVKGALNSNFLNLTTNREKILLLIRFGLIS